MVITHEQRAILDAIKSLERLEEALSGKPASADLGSRVDALIEDLKGIVGSLGAGSKGAVQNYDQATQEASQESQTRSKGQGERLCVRRS